MDLLEDGFYLRMDRVSCLIRIDTFKFMSFTTSISLARVLNGSKSVTLLHRTEDCGALQKAFGVFRAPLSSLKLDMDEEKLMRVCVSYHPIVWEFLSLH
jgi:hypothetical protein